jgi:hypothetical protein
MLHTMGSHFYGEAEKIIISEIIAAGDKGITQTELLSRIGKHVHRSTIFRVAKKGARQKKIRIKREGKNARYFAGEKAALDAKLGAFVLSSRASSKLFAGYHHYVPRDLKESDYIEEALFQFSNRVGAFVTFVFVMGMHPENTLLSTDGSEKGNPELIKEWIDNGISPAFVSRMFVQFREELLRSLSRHGDLPNDFGTKVDFLLKESLDKEIAKKVTAAFRKLYPTISKDLRDIMENIVYKIKLEKEFDELADKYSRRR